MNRRKWLAVLLACMMLPGMLWGCAEEKPEDAAEPLPQPPNVSREGWQGYPIAGLTVYLPDMFEEGRICEESGEFVSRDEDFEEDYVQLQVISGLEDALQTQVTDAGALANSIQTRVEENDGIVYASGTYWDVPYLIYSEFGSEKDYSVVGLYAQNGRAWMVEITGMHPDRAVQMVPYACGGVVQLPEGWEAGADGWMAYNIAGLAIRVPGEMLNEADFYADCAYFVDSRTETELEVMSGGLDEFDGEIADAEALADWFVRETEENGDIVLALGENQGVPYLICGDGESANLVGFYVSGEQYWMIAAENVAAEPEMKWIWLATSGKIG